MTEAGVGSQPSGPVITVEWTAREHARAVRAIMTNRSGSAFLKIGFWVLVVVGLLLLIVGGLTALDGSSWFAGVLPWLLVLLLWIAFIHWLGPFLSARAWARSHPEGHRTITYRFGDDGLYSESYLGSTIIRWHAIRRVVETSESLLLYLGWQRAVFIPRRALDPEAHALIRLHLERHVDMQRLRFLNIHGAV